MNDVIQKLKGGLIVSCQARPGNPLRGPESMAAMAKAAELGGAVGIRADGPRDIPRIRMMTDLPILGIYKTEPSPTVPYITPDFAHAKALASFGVEIIAVDATLRPRPDGTEPGALIRRIREELGIPVMADVATYAEGMAAAEAGAELVATTLSGYTDYTTFTDEPDYALVSELARDAGVPVIAEGRFLSPERVIEAFRRGAYAVVVGKAITNVTFITRRFVDAIRDAGI